MEFETNKSATAQEVSLAATPHMALQPVHTIEPDSVRIAPVNDRSNNINLESETESTAAAAQSSIKLSSHPHHSLALAVGITTSLLFGGVMAFLYFNR